jgi:hypothetical protein
MLNKGSGSLMQCIDSSVRYLCRLVYGMSVQIPLFGETSVVQVAAELCDSLSCTQVRVSVALQ